MRSVFCCEDMLRLLFILIYFSPLIKIYQTSWWLADETYYKRHINHVSSRQGKGAFFDFHMISFRTVSATYYSINKVFFI